MSAADDARRLADFNLSDIDDHAHVYGHGTVMKPAPPFGDAWVSVRKVVAALDEMDREWESLDGPEGWQPHPERVAGWNAACDRLRELLGVRS